MKIKNKDARKIKNATEHELQKLDEAYGVLMKNIQVVSTSSLIMICIIGVATTVYFQNSILNFLGLMVFAYPFYIFANREGHRDGYFEGYYESMSAHGNGMPNVEKELAGHAPASAAK